MAELRKPGRDPREKFAPVHFADGVNTLEDPPAPRARPGPPAPARGPPDGAQPAGGRGGAPAETHLGARLREWLKEKGG